MIPMRYIVAAVLLVFAWKGAAVKIPWPMPEVATVDSPRPPDSQLAWAAALKSVLPKMLPQDRQYLANFYEAMGFVLAQDGKRSPPIISDADKFIVFHSGSLRLAIEKQNVGKYVGLDKAIDQVFFASNGADAVALGEKEREQLIAACNVLAYAFRVNGE